MSSESTWQIARSSAGLNTFGSAGGACENRQRALSRDPLTLDGLGEMNWLSTDVVDRRMLRDQHHAAGQEQFRLHHQLGESR